MILALRIAIIVLVQCLFLVSMIYGRVQILREGTPILLETRPIDPRSLFRGNYIRLNYTISALDVSHLEGDNDFERWDTVYVAVEQRNKTWAATGIYHDWPRIIGSNQVILKGTVRNVYNKPRPCPPEDWACDMSQQPSFREVAVTYGIESYFVPEGEGRKIEQAILLPKGPARVWIKVAVAADGTAAIAGLLLDGQELYRERLF